MKSDADLSDAKAFVARLKAAVGAASARSVAIQAGISPTAMNQYLSGKSEPTRPMLNAIANATGVSLEWLSTGNGPMRSGDNATAPDAPTAIGGAIASSTDARLMGRLAEKILLVYKEMGVSIAIHQATERAAKEHDRIVATVTDPDDRLTEVGEVTAALRQELRVAAADPASSKRRA